MPSTWTVSIGPETDYEPTKPARVPLSGTDQQRAFWDEILTGDGNVVLSARAGTGKSTSCREGMHLTRDATSNAVIRYACFNKKLADEFAERCSEGVEVGTLHRFGFQALQRAFKSQLDQHKTYMILDGIGAKDLKRYVRYAVSSLVSAAKNMAIRPDQAGLWKTLDDLVTHFDIETWGRYHDQVIDWTVEVLSKSAEMTSLVDFDDMLWLPWIHGVRFPTVDYLYIDECQDLNPAQHALLPSMNPGGRTLSTGDPFQAIYQFRGADSDSIPRLIEATSARVMPLTVSFRCPHSHVALARELVPDFEAHPDAPDGTIEEADLSAVQEAMPGDLVLCRSNAPIIAACLKMIRNRKRAVVRGRAIGDQLVGIANRIEASTIEQFVRGVNEWLAKEVARLECRDGTEPQIEQVGDQAHSLIAVADTCGSPAEVPDLIRSLFSNDDAANRVTFSTVHRAKGSEARRVYYIQIPYSERRDKRRPVQTWESDQRRNLRYVALTRSMDTLILASDMTGR